MPRTAYVNGHYGPLSEAAVSVEDRGFQFADGVYEVIALLAGRMLDERAHLERLARSASGLGMAMPMASRALSLVLREVIRRNRLAEGLVYVQVTRGVAPRDHAFPSPDVPPSLVITARPFDFAARAIAAQQGVPVISVRDIRWQRRDLKTVGLLGNVLAKQQAKQAGAGEALFVDGAGVVSEGGSTNMWMVDKQGALITHPEGPEILSGIAREVILELAHAAKIKVTQRAFTLAEMKAAPEAFFTSTTAPLMPIIAIDGERVGKGVPGPVSLRLLELGWKRIARLTGFALP